MFIKVNLIDSDNKMYLTVDSFTDISNIITVSNNITLMKVNIKPCGYDKMYVDKDLIEVKLYQLINLLLINSMKEKLIVGIFILHYSIIYTNFLMEWNEL